MTTNISTDRLKEPSVGDSEQVLKASDYRPRTPPFISELDLLALDKIITDPTGRVLVCSASDIPSVNQARAEALIGKPLANICWSFLALDSLDPQLLNPQYSYLGEVDDPTLVEQKLKGSPYELKLFPHPVSGEAASMSLYGTKIERRIALDTQAETLDAANAVVESLIEAGEIVERVPVEYLASKDIDPDTAEQVWELFNARFQGIAANNIPIDLEEGRDETINLLMLDSTKLFLTRGEDGRVSCCLILVEDIDECGWLDGQRLRELAGTEKVVFYPGVASARDGQSHAKLVMNRAFLTMAALKNPETCFFYECTDVSEHYIPPIIEKCSTSVVLRGEQVLVISANPVGKYYFGAIVPVA